MYVRTTLILGVFVVCVLFQLLLPVLQALSRIEEARRVLAPVLAVVLGESYTRSYKRMLTVMSLAELEEVVEYKK